MILLQDITHAQLAQDAPVASIIAVLGVLLILLIDTYKTTGRPNHSEGHFEPFKHDVGTCRWCGAKDCQINHFGTL